MTEDTEPDLREPGARGTLKVADKVIEKVASAAANEVDGVGGETSRWRRAAGHPAPRATATVAGGRCRIGVDVAVSWPTPLTAVASQTRDRVRERVTALCGVDVVAVDVTIAQVVHAPAAGREVS